VLALALAAQILVVLDITAVNAALPTIGRSLRLGSADLQCPPWAGPKLTAGCRSERGQQGRGGDSAAARGSTLQVIASPMLGKPNQTLDGRCPDHDSGK
jgi:hypothetical protein